MRRLARLDVFAGIFTFFLPRGDAESAEKGKKFGLFGAEAQRRSRRAGISAFSVLEPMG